MTKEISLSLLLKVLKSAWWLMVIAAVIIGTAVAAFTELAIPKKYQSTVEFYVLNTSTTSEYITTSLLQSAEYLSKDYIQIIKGDQVIDAIINNLSEVGYDTSKISPSQIRGMISSSIATTSSTFSVTVTSTNADVSYAVANAITEESPDIIRSMTRTEYRTNLYTYTDFNGDGFQSVDEFDKIDLQDLECIKPTRLPKKATSHSSPDVASYTVIAAFFAALVTYAIVLIRKLTDTTIRSESAVKSLVDSSVIVIGTIPYWHTHSNEKKG